VQAQVFVLDVKHALAAHIERGPLTLKFEDDHAAVVTSCEKVLLRVGC
jgi:hypothetical protein